MALYMRNALRISSRLLAGNSSIHGKTAVICTENLTFNRLLNTLNRTPAFEISEEDDLEDLRKKHRNEASNIHGTGNSFAEFPLTPQLLQRLEKLGYDRPFDIQTQTLTHTLNGKNVIGRAITGSGKTLAFAIPIVQKIMENRTKKRNNNPKAILISPTRELCNQIYRSVQELSSSVRCVALYGGASFERQCMEIDRGVDVICATPGRLNDHVERGTIGLEDVKFICLDEADELLNPNFKEQIQGVLENTPEEKQMMLFSATMPSDIMDLIRRFMPDPEYVDVTRGQKYSVPESVKHTRIEVPRKLHLPTLCCLLKEHQPERCIVFLRTKDQTRQTSDLIRNARMNNISSQFINSNLSQLRRENVMKQFRTGSFNVLCATDVAARGLDIPEVDLVIQVEPPPNGADYYIHRAGRTGRAGRAGESIMIHSNTKQEMAIVGEIQYSVPLDKIPAPDNVDTMLEQLRQTSSRNLISYELANPYPEAKPVHKSNYAPRGTFSYSKHPRRYQDGNRSFNFNRKRNRDEREWW